MFWVHMVTTIGRNYYFCRADKIIIYVGFSYLLFVYVFVSEHK